MAGACRGGTAFPPEIIVKNDAKTQISLAITLESEIFVVYLQRNKTNTIMSEAELVLVEEAKKCTLYTIQFLSEDETEFEQFFNKFKDDVEFSPDLMRIVGFLGKIADFGALERYFRLEGKMSDHVVALPTVQSKLRLYCLRLSDRILVLGNGGVKNTKTYEESKELSGYVLTLQNFDRLIKEGVKDGTIIVSENKIETDKTFDL